MTDLTQLLAASLLMVGALFPVVNPLAAMLLGSFVLRLFAISIPIVQVAGGAVVAALAWKLLAAENPKPVGGLPDDLVLAPASEHAQRRRITVHESHFLHEEHRVVGGFKQRIEQGRDSSQ